MASLTPAVAWTLRNLPSSSSLTVAEIGSTLLLVETLPSSVNWSVSATTWPSGPVTRKKFVSNGEPVTVVGVPGSAR
jgi:hypothetical protein